MFAEQCCSRNERTTDFPSIEYMYSSFSLRTAYTVSPTILRPWPLISQGEQTGTGDRPRDVPLLSRDIRSGQEARALFFSFALKRNSGRTDSGRERRRGALGRLRYDTGPDRCSPFRPG